MVKTLPAMNIAESATLTDAESAASCGAHSKNKVCREDWLQGMEDQIQLELQSQGILPRINIKFGERALKARKAA